MNRPNYQQIYTDIITMNYPHLFPKCKHLLRKKNLSDLEILELNQIIFGTSKPVTQNSNPNKYKSYNKSTVLNILQFQKDNRYNNAQLSEHFNISKNTIQKWKKQFLV